MTAQPISRSDWERVKRVASEAWALPVDARARMRREDFAEDEGSRTEVQSLLESMELSASNSILLRS